MSEEDGKCDNQLCMYIYFDAISNSIATLNNDGTNCTTMSNFVIRSHKDINFRGLLSSAVGSGKQFLNFGL